MLDPFWCITISYFLLRGKWKNRSASTPKTNQEVEQETEKSGGLDPEKVKEWERKRLEQQQIADLKRQGYTDELIAVIIPTINNGQ